MKRYHTIALSISLIFFFSSLAPMVGNDLLANQSTRLGEETTGSYGDEKRDSVHIAFKKIEAGQITGAVSVLNPEMVNQDDHTVWASSVFSGRTLGMMGNTNIRGIGVSIDVADLTGSGTLSGNALFVVDGLPRDITGLRLSEIESISILKDVNAAILYGSSAINGVVMVTTKRGK